MPYINTNWIEQPASTAIHMYPSRKALTNMLISVVKSKKWSGFAILYESPSYLLHTSDLLEIYGRKDEAVIIRKVTPDTEKTDYRDILKRVKKLEESRIILECSTKILSDVMNQVNDVKSVFILLRENLFQTMF